MPPEVLPLSPREQARRIELQERQQAPHWIARWPSKELAGPLCVLTCEEFGFLQRLRDYSMTNNGIPADREFIRKLARSWHVSNYKFKRLAQILDEHFEIFDNCFFYPDDEVERSASNDRISNRSKAGQLGAAKRWGKQDSNDSFERSFAMALPSDQEWHSHTNTIQDNTNPQIEREPAAPPNHERAAAGAGPPPVDPEPLTPERSEITAVQLKAARLGLAKPSAQFCRQVLKKFVGLDLTGPQVIESLCRWEGQRSIGLWIMKTANDFIEETERQKQPLVRKPTARELQDQRMMARANAKDMAAGRGQP